MRAYNLRKGSPNDVTVSNQIEEDSEITVIFYLRQVCHTSITWSRENDACWKLRLDPDHFLNTIVNLSVDYLGRSKGKLNLSIYIYIYIQAALLYATMENGGF